MLSLIYTADSSIRPPKEGKKILYSARKTDETRRAFQHAITFLDHWSGGIYHMRAIRCVSCRAAPVSDVPIHYTTSTETIEIYKKI